MPSIALIGPGAVGCTLLAHLAETHPSRLIVAARTPIAAIEVEHAEGLSRVVPQVVTRPEDLSEPVEWILLATKTYDVPATLPWLERLVGTQTRIALLQNGVEHRDRLPTRYPADAQVPVIVECPAERLGPGRVRQRGPAQLIVPADSAGRAFARLFVGTSVRVDPTEDWTTAAWRKLCLNAAGAVSAATLQPAGIVHFPPAAELMRNVLREVVAVARAEGARLGDADAEAVFEACRRAPLDGVNSLLADRRAGRPMETDARNGVVVRRGRRHGIPTPYNETLTALLLAAELHR